ncbi:MAG TPA: sigma-54 dependent transcriptional regulator [Methylomirabilota bacterium]|jgi:DNA-binding NtrC family response regulator|nr:sigma-54 dependent transcriptional regulator [Methylomirabilota bacterium]
MEPILVVEDDPDILEVCAAVLQQAGHAVIKAESGRRGEAVLHTSAVDAVVADLKLPGFDGLDLLRLAKEIDPDIVVILITGFPAVETVVEAMKFGASDYLVKPFTQAQLLEAVRRSLQQRRTKEAYGILRSQLRGSLALGALVGQSRTVLKLFDDIRRAASVDATVLILGESGAGKELVARAIHGNGRRQEKAFLAINCAAIPENLLEAELFGYERGAFTGAQLTKEGLFEAAHQGTVFLDEICELTPNLQAKLLRALEEGAVRRLAGRTPIPFDVRFMAATNRDVQEEMRKERFREDLFFRIDVIEIQVPPLRARAEDIPLLAAHFLEGAAARYRKQIDGVTPQAMELLTRHDWPGNVRELKNAIERAVAYAKSPFLTPAELPEAVLRGAARHDRHRFREWKEKTLERLEREFIERALAEHGGNVTHTAKALGIHRSTLQRLMRKHHLPVE